MNNNRIEAIKEGIATLFRLLKNDSLASRILSQHALETYREKRGKVVLSFFYDSYVETLFKNWEDCDYSLFFEGYLSSPLLDKCSKTDARLDWRADLSEFDPNTEYVVNIYWIDRYNSSNFLNSIASYKKAQKLQLCPKKSITANSK